jgi:rRNA processing protein Gar1
MKEEWKAVKGFEGWYEISNAGRIKSINRTIVHKEDRFSIGKIQTVIGKIRKPCKNNKGYLTIQLFKNSKHHKRYIHRMVAESFIINDENKKEVNHKDGNPLNNNVENLEWVTKDENMKHALDNGLYTTEKKVKSINTITGEEIEYKSVCEAARQLKINHTAIVQNLKRRSKTCKNCIWEYI